MTHANRIVRNIAIGSALALCCVFMVTQALASPEYCKNIPPGCDSMPTDCLDALQPMLTYTRQPRVADEFANWQRWYDGGMPDRFTESDLVLDDTKGSVEIIHNCTTSPAICSAHDGRVSPDGFRIAYTLAEGDALYPVKTWGDNRLTPAIEFKAVRFSIWVYDTRTKTTQLVEKNARMPDWYSNDGLVFASSRAGTYAPWAYSGPEEGYKPMALQIFKARIVK